MRKTLKEITVIGLSLVLILISLANPLTAQIQEPFATAHEYGEMLENHWMTYDCWAHWNYILNTVDLMSYAQDEYFPVTDPYDMNMFKAWVDSNKYNEFELDRVYYYFRNDWDYGWNEYLMGVGWMWAAMSYVWAAPSVAIIEPGRSAEAAFVVKECIELLRSPAGWMDYAIVENYGDPMRDNMMWKGPLLTAEGLYALMTADTITYAPETKALARNLYETQLQNMQLPVGQGYCGGVCCEPNHWFPQCNSNGALGMILYDLVYGVDSVYQTYIGEEFVQNYLDFLFSEMVDMETSEIYRRYHPYGPQQADKEYSGFSNAFTIINLQYFAPEFAQAVYEATCDRYLVSYPGNWGTFILEVPEFDAFGNLINAGPEMPGMFGEGALNVYWILTAARIFQDPGTFNGINQFLTNMCHPYFREGEFRHDETNPDPLMAQLYNMYSGCWFFAKVHLGWDTILNHDWSRNRDENGFMLNDPWPHNPPNYEPQDFTRISSYPNPFNENTELSFELTHMAEVTVDIFDVNGRLVAQPFKEWRYAGAHQFSFNAGDLPSGVYFVRFTAENYTEKVQKTHKLVLLK